jgi:methyltransferase family protein
MHAGERKHEQASALAAEIARLARGRAREHVVVDVACGKSALLPALAKLAIPRLRYLGVDRDPRLTALAQRNAPAWAAFETAPIARAELPARPDVLCALHACGPATDDAIARAIELRARHALIVPCCHRRPARDALDGLGFPRQAILRGRFHDAMTDARRVLRLEAAGFEVVTVEFVPAGATPHNLLLRARWVGATARAERAKMALCAPLFAQEF